MYLDFKNVTCSSFRCNFRASPTFEDYLALANPYLYLKEPLGVIGDGLESVGDLLKDDAVDFYNALNSIGDAFVEFPDFAEVFCFITDLSILFHIIL